MSSSLADGIERLRAQMQRVDVDDTWQFLRNTMSDYSEDNWSAGWIHDLEFVLWERIVEEIENDPVDAARLYSIAVIAQQIGGWVIWDEPRFKDWSDATHEAHRNKTPVPEHEPFEVFVPWETWLPMYDEWRKRRR